MLTLAQVEAYIKSNVAERAADREVEEWKQAVKRLQELAVVEANRDKIRTVEVPNLESEISEKEAQLPEASKQLQEVGSFSICGRQD